MAVADIDRDRKLVGAREIVKMREERVRKYASRDRAYDTYMKYYFGRQNQSGSSSDLPVLSSNSQGRPLLRQVGEVIGVNKTYSSQRLAPIIDDYAALLGRMPNSRVEPPDSSDQGEAKAEKLTKYLIDTQELSDMDRQQAEAGFWLSSRGDALYCLEVEPDLDRVVWTTVDPRYGYPAFHRGFRRFQIYDLIVTYEWDMDAIKREFNYEPPNDDPENRQVIIYTSPFQRTVVVGLDKPVVVADIEWSLGFCPAQWVFNKTTGEMAMSDIAQSLNQQDFLDFSFNVLADGLVYNIYPIVGIKNPQSVAADQITAGPGAPPVSLGPDGDIIVRATQGDIQAAMTLINQTVNDINTSTGSSQVRQEGQVGGSIVTGRAVHAVQGPQSTRIEYKQIVLGAAIQMLNAMTLAMQEKAPVIGDAEIEIWRGLYKGKSFQEKLNPKQDIDGWYRNNVRWDSLVGMSQMQKVQLAYEGKVAKLWDALYAMDLVGVDDPIGMQERIDSEQKKEMDQQAAMQGGGPGGGGGAPGSPGPPHPPQGPGPGRPGAAPPPMIARPPQIGMTPGGGPAQQLRELLKPLTAQLKGSVWMLKPEPPQLAVSDHRDYQKVLDLLKLTRPDAKVKQVAEQNLPDSAERLV